MSAVRDYWPLVLENLRDRVSPSNYKAWFSRLEFVSTAEHGRKLIVGVPSVFNRNYIESKFKGLLKETVGKYYPNVIHLDYKIQAKVIETEPSDIAQTELVSEPDEARASSNSYKNKYKKHNKPEYQETKSIPSYLPNKSLNNLNPRYSFDNYVVTRCNDFASSVAQSVIKQPGTLYNPVFIYSGVGLGKTHMMQAVGHKILEERPDYNIKYIPAETFINQFILAIQKRQTEQFRDYYRTIDLLLIDDIQFIAGKETTQEAFFHTFNELQQQNKQIILTSDKPPQSLGGIEERLISRFEMGMVVDIQQPDLESRIAIIKDKAERLQLPLQSEHIQYLAESITTNIRDIEGALNKISAKLRINPKQADSILSQVVSQRSIDDSEAGEHKCGPDKILQSVCRFYNVSKAEVLGDRRSKSISTARQITMWFFKHELGFSYPVIGKMIGNRDHTTAMYGSAKVEKTLKKDVMLKQQIEAIKIMMKQ
jgi:chromosomal replication initiator protein